MRVVMFVPSTFGSTKNISGLASPVSIPLADFLSGLVTVTVWVPPVTVLDGTVTAMSIESVTIAFCTALPSTVTAAFGSKLVPLIMNVVPSEHSGLGTIDVIVGGGELFFSEQPVVASSKQPSTDKPVDRRMVAGRVQLPYLLRVPDPRQLDGDRVCACTRS